MTEAVNPIRKPTQPYAAATAQPWVTDLVSSQHEEALLLFGELALFTLMWRPIDFEAGRVNHCSTCYATTGAQGRYAAAFEQPTRKECPDCYGTTFEGGWRAQIVRPALVADRNSEVSEQRQGVVTSDTIRVETTGDFTLHKGDYLFRFDNTRFQVEEKNEDVVRNGFGGPFGGASVAGSTTAHMEETTSVAFRIPPVSPGALTSLLAHDGPFLLPDLTAQDIVSSGGYV